MKVSHFPSHQPVLRRQGTVACALALLLLAGRPAALAQAPAPASATATAPDQVQAPAPAPGQPQPPSTTAGPTDTTTAAARTVAAQVCSSCHGAQGISASPEFPILAGQQRDYLAAQLRAFRTRTRAEPDAHDYMWGMATMLDERLIEPLAAYYAALPAAPGRPGNAALMARGALLYRNGLADREVAACAGCHGAEAGGASIFPRLAGQHARYLEKQLLAIQGKLRDSPVMHGIVRNLQPDEIQALAAWLASR